MVKTGARAESLKALMTLAGFKPVGTGPKAPRIADLPDEAHGVAQGLYRALGGIEPNPPYRPGSWDLAFYGGLVVELDEELHFNRYRAQTLDPSWAASLPWRKPYLEFSRTYELQCLSAGRWGKRWTNPSCEVMFGPPTTSGDLEGAGAPRWKQRAFYDAFKDVAALHSSTIRLSRISVWDTIGENRIGDVLTRGVPVNLDQLRELVEQRTTSP